MDSECRQVISKIGATMHREAKLPKLMVTLEMPQIHHNIRISAILHLLFAMMVEAGVGHLDPSKMAHLPQEWKLVSTMLQVAIQAMVVHVDLGATQGLMTLVPAGLATITAHLAVAITPVVEVIMVGVVVALWGVVQAVAELLINHLAVGDNKV